MKALFAIAAFILLVSCNSTRSLKTSHTENHTLDSLSVSGGDSSIHGLDIIDTNWYSKKMDRLKNELKSDFQDYTEIFSSVIGALNDDNKLSGSQRDSLIKILMNLKPQESKVKVTNSSGNTVEITGPLKKLNLLFDSVNTSLQTMAKMQKKFDSASYTGAKTTSVTSSDSSANTSKQVISKPRIQGYIMMLFVGIVIGLVAYHYGKRLTIFSKLKNL